MSRTMRKIHHRHYNCAGLTLVELMIALVLSMLLMTGVLTIFASTKTTSRLQSGLATVQENGRHALHLLVRDIRGAGFGGCAGMDLTITNVIADDPPMDDLNSDVVVSGINDFAAADDYTDTSKKYDAVLGTDVIRIRGAGDGLAGLVGNTVPVNANIQTTVIKNIFEAGDILMITDCEGTDVFRATNVSHGSGKTTIAHSQAKNSSNNLSKPYDKDAFLMAFRSNAYFIKDTGRTNRVGQPIRALYWRDETRESWTSADDQELVDGIEDMQITYGVDGDGNGMVDKFVDADGIEPTHSWADVLAVKVSLLVSSVENAAEAPASYRYVGVTTVPADANDMQLRQEMTSTVAIRNRVD